MIPRRVWINLAAFGALFAVLGVWAVRNVIHLDAIERPYRVVAAFESSPGLRPNVEVTYHGLQVGSVDQVRLEAGRVEVALDIDRGVRLPEGVGAAVRRKSAVGEPYVALEAPAGYQGGAPYLPADGRASIGLDATSVPLAYGELFSALDDLVAAVPADSLQTVVHELATALGGRGRELRTIVEGSAAVTGRLAEEADVLDRLADQLTSLTHTLAERRGTVGAAFDDLADLTSSLAAATDDIEALLATAPALGERVATLLRSTLSDLGCTFADTGALFEAAGSPEHVAQLLSLLGTAGEARDALDAALVEEGEDGADGPYLGGSFIPDLDVGAPPTYSPRPTLPEPPELQPCDAPGAAAPLEVDDGSAAGSGEDGAPSSEDRWSASAPPMPPAPEAATSSTESTGGQNVPLDWLIGGAATLVAAITLVAWRPWRRRREAP